MPTVALALSEDVPVFEAAVVCEIFRTRAVPLVPDWYELSVCAPGEVTVGKWFRTQRAHGLAELARADTVIVPARHDDETHPPAELVAAVRAAADAGARVAGICTGAFVLAAAGLLDGRRATTHWMHTDRLARTYPAITVERDVLYVDEGQVLTSAGTAAGVDLCLHLVSLDFGSEVANELARRMVTPPHRTGGQAQYVSAPVPAADATGLGDVLDFARSRLHTQLTVTDLADRANLSTRQLTRRFGDATGRTPLQWLLTERLRHAQRLLETTDRSVEQIATDTGMGTATSLRRHFRRDLGVTPDAYRRTFRGTGSSH